MRDSGRARVLEQFSRRRPARRFWLDLATRIEGGQLYSTTLRRVLADDFDVHVGEYSYGSLLLPGMADPGTYIGRYVSIGPNVRRIGAAHPLDRFSLHPFFYNPALGMVNADADVSRTPCVVESEAWIGANTVILPGCRRIGIGAVVGASSVVTRDVEDFAIVAGNPARRLKYRFDHDRRVEMLKREAWLLSPWQRLKHGL